MWKKIVITAAAAAILTGSLAGCGNSADKIVVNDAGQNVISIMAPAYQAESASDDAAVNPVIAEVEKRLNTDIKITFAASSNYGEKVTATMGAGTYPNIMKVPDRTTAIIQACRSNLFWDVTDKIKEKNEDGSYKYPNLAKSSDEVLRNISIDGRIYGLYSSRDLGRNGVTIRKDWLKNIGYDHYPATLEEFYDVCKKFTENDPDGNGVNDTTGLIMCAYKGSIDNLLVWAGAPNGYGVTKDENGETVLYPAFMFDEYLEGLKYIKDMYDNGYINQNWATLSSEKWNEPLLNGEGGIIIDVADRARRAQTNIKDRNPNAEIGVFGSVAVDGEHDRRVLPTTGFNGFFVFPKASVKTEEELDICLKFMNDLEDPEISDLLQRGIEGRHYIINENGEYEKKTLEDGSTDTTYDKEFADFNQMCTFISGESALNIPYASKVAEDVENVLEDNVNYTVPNPAAPYVSETATLRGTSLDDIISEANTKFIKGDITEDQWKAEVERWKTSGGSDVIKELTEQYLADPSVEK